MWVMPEHRSGQTVRDVMTGSVVTVTEEGVVDVVHALGYDHDDTHPAPFPRA